MGLSIAKLVCSPIKAESDSRSSLETSIIVSKEGSNSKASITTNDSTPRATNTSSDREALTERKLKVGESKQISIAQRIPQGERVLVHPINVGQGDAILLEIQSQNGQSEKHLTDGGQGQRTQNTQYYQNLKDTLRARGCLVQKNRTEIGNTLEDRICEQVTMDSIIITHPNLDHYGGINRLLQDFTITAPITTTLASCLKVGHSGGPKNTKIGEVFLSGERDQIRHWFPLTGEGENGRRHTNIKTLPKGSTVEVARNEDLTFDAKQLNATSILTTVRIPGSKYDFDVVLSGDSYGYVIDEKLGLKDKSVGVFQVPHHGSKYNLRRPRASTVTDFTHFYSSFNAHIYLISHGDHRGYNHPHSEVITGILSAAVQKKRRCKIVVTATWFEASKIDEKNISNWRDYVDIFYFKQGTPYVTLDPNDENLPKGLQLFVKKVPAQSLEDKLGEKNLQRREVSRDGNSFFNAVSGALTNKNTPIQLREKLVEHLMGLQGLYYPRSGVTTMEEYYEIVSNYLLDGHFSSDIEKILPEAMARTLNIRIQVIPANPEQKDKFYGVESTQTVIQLIHDETGNGHYDYALPATSQGLSMNTSDRLPPVKAGTTEQTPIKIRETPPSQAMTNGRASRRLLFPNDSVNQKKSPLNKVCHFCKQPANPTDRLYICKNSKCPVKTHLNCEEESRKTHTFVRNFKKCVYCRTCKECNGIMGTVHASCHFCGGAGHVPCIRRVPKQTRDGYTCRICREQSL